MGEGRICRPAITSGILHVLDLLGHESLEKFKTHNCTDVYQAIV